MGGHWNLFCAIFFVASLVGAIFWCHFQCCISGAVLLIGLHSEKSVNFLHLFRQSGGLWALPSPFRFFLSLSLSLFLWSEALFADSSPLKDADKACSGAWIEESFGTDRRLYYQPGGLCERLVTPVLIFSLSLVETDTYPETENFLDPYVEDLISKKAF